MSGGSGVLGRLRVVVVGLGVSAGVMAARRLMRRGVVAGALATGHVEVAVAVAQCLVQEVTDLADGCGGEENGGEE